MAGSGYQNPLRSVKGLSAERIDQGVDYGGVGPVYAVGPGVITNVSNSGWPGGTFISERLTGGPDAGKYVYEAETANPRVSVGQTVDSSTITSFMNGPASIEIGWAQPPGSGSSMAMTAGQVTGSGVETAYGKNFSDFMQSLGAPAGVANGPVHGTVPANFGNTAATPSSGSGALGGLLPPFPSLNPVPYLLKNLGVQNMGDLVQRGALIIFGALLLIIGVIKLFPGATGDALEAAGVASAQPELAAAGAAVKGHNRDVARNKALRKLDTPKEESDRIMREARARQEKTTVALGPNATKTDEKKLFGKEEKSPGNPGGVVPKSLDVTSNEEAPF